MRTSIIALAMLAQPALVSAAVTLPPVFADNMILQREMMTPIWGTAEPGEKIIITLGEHTKSTTADDQGKWTIRIGPMKAGGPFDMTVAGKETVTFKNVLIGDVWVASGHSNMYWCTHQVKEDLPQVRIHTCGDAKAKAWGIVGTKPGMVRGWTLPYWFARKLHRDLDVPIGLICAGAGCSYVSSWKADGNNFQTFLRPVVPFGIKGAIKVYDQTNPGNESEQLIKGWRKEWGQGDFPFIYAPFLPNFTGFFDEEPDPVLGQRLGSSYELGGEIMRAEDHVLNLLNLPNVLVVAAHDAQRSEEPFHCHWSDKRMQAERMALAAQGLAYGKKVVALGPIYDSMTIQGNKVRLRFKHVGSGLMARSYHRPQRSGGLPLRDFRIAGEDSIWIVPKEITDPSVPEEEGFSVLLSRAGLANPKKVRYANAPYALTYGFAIEGDKVRVTFKPGAEDMAEHEKEPLRGFVIAGEDQRWYRAEARIEGDAVVVWSDRIPRPAGVRYAWAGYASGNLYNRDGLPAPRFRTDRWAAKTTVAFPGSQWPIAFNRFGLHLPQLFTDHMVLQQGQRVPIWGHAEPGDKITVTLGTRTASAVSDAKGQWLAWLGPLEAGGPASLSVSDPYDTITFRDVLVGEVWLVIGDHCAAAPFVRLRSTADDRPALRLFSNGYAPSQRMLVWAPDRFDPRLYETSNTDAKESTRMHFSGVGYWLGRKLHDQTKQPVGILVSATEKPGALFDWLPPSVLEANPDLKRFGKATPHQSSAYSRYVQSVNPYAIKGIVWCGGTGAEEAKALLPERSPVPRRLADRGKRPERGIRHRPDRQRLVTRGEPGHQGRTGN